LPDEIAVELSGALITKSHVVHGQPRVAALTFGIMNAPVDSAGSVVKINCGLSELVLAEFGEKDIV
jgi:hypothetical protein